MRPKKVSVYDVLKAGDLRPLQTLVDAAYSSTPPDPAKPSPDFSSLVDAASQLANTTGVVRTVADFFLLPTIEFIWDPSRAEDLGDFLYEKYEDDEDAEEKMEARIEALENGAKPTEEELDALKEEYDYGEGCFYNPRYYLYEVVLPAASQELRPVYLLSERAEMGQHSDPKGAYGPFLSVEDALSWSRNLRSFETLMCSLYGSKDERELLRGKIKALDINTEIM